MTPLPGIPNLETQVRPDRDFQTARDALDRSLNTGVPDWQDVMGRRTPTPEEEERRVAYEALAVGMLVEVLIDGVIEKRIFTHRLTLGTCAPIGTRSMSNPGDPTMWFEPKEIIRAWWPDKSEPPPVEPPLSDVDLMNQRLEERTQGMLASLARARYAPSAASFRAGWEAAMDYHGIPNRPWLEEALQKHMEQPTTA